MEYRKIAVVIVNYNGLNDSVECIESLLASSVQIKVVYVDNASREDEVTYIENNFQDVKVFRLNTNVGFAAGNNVGIKWALENGYEYVALLNNDTIVRSDTFKLLLDYADEKTIVSPYIFYHSHAGDLWYGGGKVNRKTGNAEHFYNIQNKPFECTFLTGCCFVAHRNVWKDVGLLDEDFFMYHEDTEFSIRLFQKNKKMLVVPSARIWHKVGKSSGGEESAFCIYYVTRNRLILLKRYKEFFSRFAFFYAVITRFIRMIALLLKGENRGLAFWSGINDYRKGLMGKRYKI